MSPGAGTLQWIAAQLAGAMRPLEQGFRDPEAFRTLLFQLGWDVPGLPPSYVAAADKAVQAGAALEALSDQAGVDEVLAVVGKVGDAYRAVGALTEAPPGIDPAVFLPALGRRLFEFLLGRQLLAEAPRWSSTLEALGVIALEDTPAAGGRPGFTRLRFDWNQIPAILSHPGLIPARLYGWGTDNLKFEPLAQVLGELVSALGLPSSLDRLSPSLGAALQSGATAPPVGTARRALTAVLFDIPINGSVIEVGLMVAELPAEGAALPGVIVQPAVPNGIAERVDLGDGWAFVLRAGTDLSQQLAVVIRPGEVGVRYPFAPGHALPSGGFGASLVYDAKTPLLLFGEPRRTRLELSTASMGVEVDARAGDLELKAAAGVKDLRLVVSPEGADAFLGSVLGGSELPISLQFELTWSSRTGLSVLGGAGATLTLYPHLDLGLVRVDRVDLAVLLAAGTGTTPALQARAAAAFSGELGPIVFSVDRLGAELAFTFAEGNAGPFDVRLHPLWPTGVGLAVDVAGLTGGGFLSHDEAAAQYAGMLQLTYQQFQLQAFGLIATKLPTGPGYSLVAMIDANFPPIELVAGFTLNGAGGLLGIHRTVSTDALQAALKAHTLSNFLFAKNPVANAPQLLTDLATFFPPAAGRYVFGPLLQIGWGAPTVITIDLALILELPDPVRLVLIGEMAVLLPEPDAVLLELHMDVLGTIDFGTDEGSLDAVLHDSRLTRFPLHGAMALRGCWAGGGKTFLLAVGGFHPAFQPPSGFPTLDRVSISMPSGHIAKLNLNGYLAVTSNTLQIGAHLDVFVGVDEFGISGYLSFDTLIERRPFHFEADISGGVTLSVDHHDVMALQLDANMAGPAPWHVAGQVHFSVLGFGVTKHFSAEFGDPAAAQPLVQVDVGQLVRAALADPRSFAASLAANENGLVSLRTPLASGVVLAHPGASLKIEQHVVPLGLSITRFGAAAPLGDTQFAIAAVTIDGTAQPSTPVFDDFAPAQFLDLSHDEELSSPSFESFPAGVSLGEGAVTFGRATTTAAAAAMARGIAFETWFVDTPDSPPREDTGVPAPPRRLTAILTALADSGQRRYAAPSQPVVRGPLHYVVATTDQIALAGVGAAMGQTYAQARAAMAAAIAQNPDQRGALQVVARYEVA